MPSRSLFLEISDELFLAIKLKLLSENSIVLFGKNRLHLNWLIVTESYAVK